MTRRPTRSAATVLCFAATGALMLPACYVAVDDEVRDRGADVRVETPLGDMRVHTNLDTVATGLSVYPGARPRPDDDERTRNATVRIDSSLFDLDVAAASYETDASPEAVIAFYQRELSAFGDVTTCRGDVDFDRLSVICREQATSGDVLLVVGTERRHRMATVTAHNEGSAFSLVAVNVER